ILHFSPCKGNLKYDIQHLLEIHNFDGATCTCFVEALTQLHVSMVNIVVLRHAKNPNLITKLKISQVSTGHNAIGKRIQVTIQEKKLLEYQQVPEKENQENNMLSPAKKRCDAHHRKTKP
ncbi:hypothetical protein ACJX0J_024934, partial [Zea mays]